MRYGINQKGNLALKLNAWYYVTAVSSMDASPEGEVMTMYINGARLPAVPIVSAGTSINADSRQGPTEPGNNVKWKVEHFFNNETPQQPECQGITVKDLRYHDNLNGIDGSNVKALAVDPRTDQSMEDGVCPEPYFYVMTDPCARKGICFAPPGGEV